MEKEYLTLNKVSSYKLAFNLSNEIWNVVLKWEYLAKNTVGTQLIRSADSVSANIAEGFGRYGKKDKIYFYRIARASVYESLDWIEKSKRRGLLSENKYKHLFETLKLLPKDINSLIKFTRNNLND
jgi:four helix bundle protein